jgi:hypothetical protein
LAINLVVQTDEISVFAPPNIIDVQVDIGPQGQRGNKFYVASGNPNTNTVVFVNDPPLLGDFYIRNDEGPEYGQFYKYVPSLNTNQWEIDFNMQEVVEQYFLNNSAATTTYLTQEQADGRYLTLDGLADLELTDILSGANSDQINEGSINLYHTTERAQDAAAEMLLNAQHTGIAVSYNDPQNTFSLINTGIRNVTGQSGQLDVTVNPVSRVANIRFPDNVNIPNNLTISQDLILNGQLIITSEANQINLESLLVEDAEIVLNSNVLNVLPSSDAQIRISRGLSPDAAFRWNETTDAWQIGLIGSDFYNIWNDNTSTISLNRVTSSQGVIIASATAPSSPVEGQVYYNTVQKRVFYYDGQNFVEVGSGSSGSAGAVIEVATTTINSSSSTIIQTFDKNEFRSGEFYIQVTKDSNYRTSKLTVVHDGSESYLTEYAIIEIGSIPVTVSTNIQGDNVLITVVISNANISDTAEVKVGTNVLVEV